MCWLFVKDKEYREALEAFDGKNREKTQLVNKLMEVKSIDCISLTKNVELILHLNMGWK